MIRTLNTIQDEDGLEIRVISTDRHNQIKKLMHCDPRFNTIIHQFDPWHVSKSITKKIIAASKKKGMNKYKASEMKKL